MNGEYKHKNDSPIDLAPFRGPITKVPILEGGGADFVRGHPTLHYSVYCYFRWRII